MPTKNKTTQLRIYLLLTIAAFVWMRNTVFAQTAKPVLQYTVSMPLPASHYFHVDLYCSGWSNDSIELKMPKWMPGYYQLMNYGKAVENTSAKDNKGKGIAVKQINDNTWQLAVSKNKPFTVSYDVKTDKQFVASPYIDSAHAYIIPTGLFLYVPGHINMPVGVTINTGRLWKNIATGLETFAGKTNEFTAPDFDILYDCPLLIGNLEELSPFEVDGIKHRFVGYKMSEFNKAEFMGNLQKMIKVASGIIGHIPYKQYTFMGIGPGRGGIEHLNSTTVSFDGKELNTAKGTNRTMSFLAHEYFHHYNIKRIRPFELGPFDYDKENRTNLLWVSEGLSVYYEYMIIKRAGIIDEQVLFGNFENNINALENNPGRMYQSLAQSSYHTWSDGPFGTAGNEPGKSISYYVKGPVVGMLLDFAIRQSTQNKKSLDDVFRLLYWKYYMQQQRGFTDAEFQEASESVAGTSLNALFEYVYTTKELDYNKYLVYAGLKLLETTNVQTGKKEFKIARSAEMNAQQKEMLEAWLKQ